MTLQAPTIEPAAVADLEAMRALGRALTVLRVRVGFTQAQAAAAFGTTPQGWGKYESGKASTIFRPSVQRRLVTALGLTAADLRNELAHGDPRPADEDWTEGGRFLSVGAPA